MKNTVSKRYTAAITVFVLMLCTPEAFAQKDSLDYYTELAAKNNPAVQQRLLEYEAALQRPAQAGSLPDPQLNMGFYLSPMEIISGKQIAQLQFMQMFPWFGVLQNAKSEMALMAKARYESFRDARLQVIYEVQRSGYELQKTRQLTGIYQKNLAILHTLERLLLVKFKAGSLNGSSNSSANTVSSLSSSATTTAPEMNSMGGKTANSPSTGTSLSSNMQPGGMPATSGSSGLADLYRIQIDIAELENNIALLEKQQVTLTANLNLSLSRPLKTPVLVSDTLIPSGIDAALLTLNDSMFVNNPMLGMLQYEQQSIEARRKMISRMGYPMVGLGVSYSLINKSEMSTSSMNGKDMIMPMVTVTLPIYRKKYKAMQTEADLQQQAAGQNYKATENSLQAGYYEALQSYQDAQLKLTLYEKQTQLTRKTMDILLKSFSASGAGLADILQIRRQMLDYELRQTEAIADYNTAIALLKRLAAVSAIQ
jgi:outer membrane protein TolC